MPDMTYKKLIANLDDATRADLLQRCDAAGLLRLSGHLSALALTAIWIMAGWPGWQPALAVHGVLLVFLFTLLHECTHQTPFKSPWLSRVTGTICGFLLLLPLNWFTFFHLAHHRHTHDPDSDPELATPKPRTWPEYLVHLSGIPVWISQIKAIVMNALYRNDDPFVPVARRRLIRLEATAHLVLYAAVAAAAIGYGLSGVLWLWILPAILGQPFLRAYLLAEHTMCPHSADMLDNSRTTLTNAVVRFFAWNMPYHAEHHTYPSVPFHKLPKFHGIIARHLRSTEHGYTRFHRRYTGQFN
jgi:fatty acid desaturase